MTRSLSDRCSASPLEQVLQQIALLDRTQLEQLQKHLTELLRLLPPRPTEVPTRARPIQELPAEVTQRYALNQVDPLRGSRGGGSIRMEADSSREQSLRSIPLLAIQRREEPALPLPQAACSGAAPISSA